MKPRLTFLLPALLLVQACAVFEPVGSFFVQGYRNTVTYFNAFYNAERLFSEAEEEYLKAYRTHQEALRDGPLTEFRVPPAAAKNFNAVIDKCSNILTFQASSDYVQDALFLIARSYDYLGEGVKAERKYAELLAQFPGSAYRTEAVARLGGILLAQERSDEARVLLERAEQEAIASGNTDILAFVLEQLAILHRNAGDVEQAHRYYSRLQDVSEGNEKHLPALIDFARLQLDVDRPEMARQIARNISELTDDQFYLYDARMVEIDALNTMGRHEEALTRLDETLGDFRFQQHQGLLRLQKGNLLLDAGREDQAVDEYRYVDTTFSRRVPGARAAFALGGLYAARGEYENARSSFERGATVPAAAITAESRKKNIALRDYIALLGRYSRVDSGLTALRDSVGAAPDSRVDSLESLKSSLMQDMGDWHYEQWQAYDSAFTWLTRAVDTGGQRPGKARAYFVLADIAAGGQVPRSERPDEYYRRIVDEYPNSVYANESRRRLGIERKEVSDPGFTLYRTAETLLDDGNPASALRVLDSLSASVPESPYAVQGLFAAGWIYENLLASDDSARAKYARVVRSGSPSPFVQEAKNRLAAIGMLPADSARAAQVKPDSGRPVRSGTLPSNVNEADERRRPTQPQLDQ